MKLLINSEPKQFSGKCISELIQSLNLTTANGMALAVNDKVVTITDWIKFELNENDKITIIQATQGG
jgi:sulfur carrier protein